MAKIDFNQQFVITVSREMGSGGHTIGRKLAERLGVRFCDKQVMMELMQQFNLTVYEIENIKARKKSWLGDLFDKVAPVARKQVYLQSSPYAFAEYAVSADDIAKAESEILTALASEGSCVVTGRAGFAILKDQPNKLDVFIRCSEQKRIDRVVAKQDITPEQAKILLDSVDESRENYVKRISGRSRYDARNYDIVLNVDNLTEDEAVDMILRYAGL